LLKVLFELVVLLESDGRSEEKEDGSSLTGFSTLTNISKFPCFYFFFWVEGALYESWELDGS